MSIGRCVRWGAASIVACAALAAAVATTPPALAQPPGSHPWLGVATTHSEAGGVEVRRVVRHSPADRAGLRSRDRVLKVDGVPTDSPTELTRLVRQHDMARPLAIDLARDGAAVRVEVTLAPAPREGDILRIDAVGSPLRAWTGLKPVAGSFPTEPGALVGRVVILEFWATWCGPCRMLSPVLDGWQRRFGAQGLTVVGISSEETDVVANYAARSDASRPLAADPSGSTSQEYGVSALPTVFVVDKRGIVRDVLQGFDSSRLAETERLVTELLSEPASSK